MPTFKPDGLTIYGYTAGSRLAYHWRLSVKGQAVARSMISYQSEEDARDGVRAVIEDLQRFLGEIGRLAS